MAYAASVSLTDVLERFYFSPDRFAHVHCPESLPFIERLHEMAESMLDFDFEELRPVGVESLEKQLRDALWRAEDAVESYWLSHSRSSASESPSNFSQHLLEVMQEIKSGMKRMTKFAYYHKQDSVSFAASVLSSIDDSTPRCENKMVGLDEELEELKSIILGQIPNQHLGGIVIHGMGGIGKTSLAKAFYNDPDVRSHFSIGAWAKISLQHCVRDILLSLLNTMQVFDQNISIFGLIEDNINDERLANIVHERLVNERYVVVVDCLCEIDIDSWNYIKRLLPDSNNGSRIIFVNRWKLPDGFVFVYFKKLLLDTSHSWKLLREVVFGDEPFSHVLEEIGKRIAKNCGGLPLAIVTVGLHLAKEEKTAVYWNKVADSGNSIAYAADGGLMFERLGWSYKHLPQYLRPIFLYLATFRERYEIILVEIRNLWIAEGFVGLGQCGTAELLISEWIHYFKDRNIITYYGIDGEGDWTLHHAMWHFCRNEAQRSEFFHVMKMQNDWEDFPRSMKINNIRRLVIWKNVLLGVKDIFKRKHSIISSIRSILLTGPHHPYPLTVDWGSYKMLRVVNALSIRFYEFPIEILRLVFLRYLALTLNRGEVPPGISKLRNLQFLIVDLLMKVIPFGEAPSYLPTEIWEMQQLIHLEVKGSDLPIPAPHSGALLPNLVGLCGVSPHSCAKEVLRRIPNLKLLAVLIDLVPKNDVDAAPLRPFDHLNQLHQLQHLFCKINNPYFEGYPKPQVASMPKNIRVSMDSLTSLTLVGCGFPWKSIKQITRLPVLEYLFLHQHSFQGSKWKLSNKRFKQLKGLHLDELDLVYWTARSGEFFPCLRELTIRGCHKLQQMPYGLKNCRDLCVIEVVDSSREVEDWARSIEKERSGTSRLSLMVSSPREATRGIN